MALLLFMQWYRKNVGGPMACTLVRGGELESEFAALCKTRILARDPWHKRTRRRRLLRKIGLDRLGKWFHARSVSQVQLERPVLIYCNTTATSQALEAVVDPTRRVLCHVHELDFTLRNEIGLDALQSVLAQSNRLIACSLAVATNLIERHQIPKEKIDVVHEWFSPETVVSIPTEDARQWLRQKLGLRSTSIVVGAAGSLGWRKGPDLFVQMALTICQLQPQLDIHFLWLGESRDSPQGQQFLHDVDHAGLGQRVTLIPSQPDPTRYFRGLDLFVLSSREDPYPLVCLEAAACGVPIICFANAGGMPEFVEDDCGAIVPYLDIRSLAATVIELAIKEDYRSELGRNAQTKVHTRHDISLSGPKILEAMKKTLAGSA